MYLYTAIAVVFAGLLFVSRREKLREPPRRGLRCWYRGASYLYRRFTRNQKPELKNMALALLILCGGNLLALGICLVEGGISPSPLKSLERGDYLAGAREETLEVEGIGKEHYTITLPIPSRTYTKSETDALFTEAIEHMDSYILGENQSAKHINKDMNLLTQIPDTPIQVSWLSNRPEVLDWEGKIGETVSKEGVMVTLQAELRYQEESRSYTRNVRVYPKEQSEQQRKIDSILEAAKAQNEDTNSPDYILPTQAGGEKIKWFPVARSDDLLVGGMALLIAVALIVDQKRETVQRREKHQARMMMDYPDILSKFMLLLNAGISMRKAVARIALDYKKKPGKRDGYEEILLTYYEMERGISEKEAYEHMSKRCDVPSYKAFAMLLVQNLQKGNQKLVEMMERETVMAFEERKRRAKILGEQAGTKLLLPMMAMLLIVFAILLVPAFLSF